MSTAAEKPTEQVDSAKDNVVAECSNKTRDNVEELIDDVVKKTMKRTTQHIFMRMTFNGCRRRGNYSEDSLPSTAESQKKINTENASSNVNRYQLRKAVNAILKGETNVKYAAKIFEVPRHLISQRIEFLRKHPALALKRPIVKRRKFSNNNNHLSDLIIRVEDLV